MAASAAARSANAPGWPPADAAPIQDFDFELFCGDFAGLAILVAQLMPEWPSKEIGGDFPDISWLFGLFTGEPGLPTDTGPELSLLENSPVDRSGLWET
mmetsp:Transcript_31580/g.57398  ORF Transcript_31580/g.57398 Transcript_31580/m.57398 type:complete len:99 (-) Transcript_31580:307-603(-)